MTSQGNGHPTRYKVDHLGSIKQSVKELHLEAANKGKGDQFLDALLAVFERLRNNPHQFGEPLFHYHTLNLVYHHAILPPLVVDFVINEQQHFVVLKALKLL